MPTQWDTDVTALAAEVQTTFGRSLTLAFNEYAAFNTGTGGTSKTITNLSVTGIRREMDSEYDRGGKRILTVIYDFVKADLGSNVINARTEITDGTQRFLVVAADYEADEKMVRVKARRTA